MCIRDSYIRGEEILKQHFAFGFDLHNLHNTVEHVVFHALDDVLCLLGIEAVSLNCRLYPREDLGELPVLYQMCIRDRRYCVRSSEQGFVIIGRR